MSNARRKGRRVPTKNVAQDKPITKTEAPQDKGIITEDLKSKRLITFFKIYNFLLIWQYLYYTFNEFNNNGESARIITNICVVMFLACALIIGQTKNKYHYPGISELRDETYWTFVSLMQSAILAIYFAFITNNILIRYTIITVISVLFMLSLSFYQTKILGSTKTRKRIERLQTLAKKAKLTDEELEAIRAEIIEQKSHAEHPPIIWKIFKLCIAFIVALLINTYAQPLLEFLTKIRLQ